MEKALNNDNNKSIKDSHKFNSFYDNVNDDLILAKPDDNSNQNNEQKSITNHLNQEKEELHRPKDQIIIESNNPIINVQELSETDNNNTNHMNENDDLINENGATCEILNEENSNDKDNKLKSSSNTTLNSFFNNKIELDSSILIMECDKTQDYDQIKLDDSMNSVISNTFNKSIKSDEDEVLKYEEHGKYGNTEIVATNFIETKISENNSPKSTPSENQSPLAESIKDDYSNADSLNDSTKLNSDKLKLHSIVNAVGFFMFPSASLINLALKSFLIENGLFDLFE